MLRHCSICGGVDHDRRTCHLKRALYETRREFDSHYRNHIITRQVLDFTWFGDVCPICGDKWRYCNERYYSYEQLLYKETHGVVTPGDKSCKTCNDWLSHKIECSKRIPNKYETERIELDRFGNKI